MKKILSNVVLFILAHILYLFIKPVNFIYSMFSGVTLNQYLEDSVDTINKSSCMKYSKLWRKLLITEDGVGFEDSSNFMSFWLGANKHLGTLTKTGLFICNVLDFFDKGHVDRIYNKYK